MRHSTSLSAKILILVFFIFSMCLPPEGLSAEPQKVNEESKTSINSEGFPKIQFDELSYDFGKSFEDKTLEHIFSFKNIGTGILQIIHVKAG